MKTSELEIKVIRKQEELERKLSKADLGFGIPNPKIEYNLKDRFLGKCWGNYLIQLSPHLLKEYKDEYINYVFVHEYAHAVVNTLYPNGMNGVKRVRPHGKEFKKVCRLFGIDGGATTEKFLDSKRKIKGKQKRWTYTCDCREHKISTTIHNRIQKSGKTYQCTNCKSNIEYIENK